MRNSIESGRRGAALILEIIIYLVIVALIAVAVISGVRAVRDLVFTSHAKGDVQNAQTWMEGKYSQDNKYPSGSLDHLNYPDRPIMTTANGQTNAAYASSVDGSQSGYCILVNSSTISNTAKAKFWIISTNPSRIYQSGTSTNGGNSTPPTTGITGVTCPP